jgi:hypothetical protein
MPHFFDLRIVSVKGAPDTELVGRNDLYVRVEVFELNSATPSAKMDTPVLDGCGTSGTWNHLFKGLTFNGDPDQARVKLTLMNKNLISDDQLGLFNVYLAEDRIVRGIVLETALLLNNCKTQCEMAIRLMPHTFGRQPTQEEVKAAWAKAGCPVQQQYNPAAVNPQQYRPPQVAPAYAQSMNQAPQFRVIATAVAAAGGVPLYAGAGARNNVVGSPFPTTSYPPNFAPASPAGMAPVRAFSAPQPPQAPPQPTFSTGYPMPAGFAPSSPQLQQQPRSPQTIAGYGVVSGPTGTQYGAAPAPQTFATGYPL